MGARESFIGKQWFPLAVAGLSCYFCCTESYRYTALSQLSGSVAIKTLINIIALIALAAIIIPLSRKHLQLYRRKSFIIGITVCMIAKICLQYFDLSFIGANTQIVLSQVFKAFETLLLLAFAEFFLALRPSTSIKAFAEAIIISSILQICVGTFQRDAGICLILVATCISAPLLYLAGKGWGDWGIGATVYGGQHRDESETGSAANVDTFSFVSTCITMFLLPVLFGTVHQRWLPLQDGGFTSLLIQISAATGSLLAGNIILALRKSINSKASLDLCKDLVLPAIIGALYLSTFLTGNFSAAYIVLLNIAQKFALLLIWIVPFFYVTKQMPLQLLAILTFAYNLGKALLNILAAVMDMESAAFSIAIGGILLIILALAVFSRVKQKDNAELQEYGIANSIFEPGSSSGFKRRLRRAIDEICQEEQLTPRESQVFTALAKGRSAERISRELNVSIATVRTHITHVYQKTGYKSQQELMDVVESRAESLQVQEADAQ